MSNNVKTQLEYLVKISPLIGVFLIFLGILKLDIFYSHFDINIVDYLELSEILTSFLDDINLFLLSIILMLCYAIFGATVTIRIMTRVVNKSRKKEVDENTIVRSGSIKQRSKTGIIIAIIITAIGCYFLFCYQKVWILFIVTLFAFQLILLLTISINNMFGKLSENATYIISLIFLFLIFTCIKARFDILKIESSKGEAVIVTDYEKIIMTKDEVLIGKTNRYLFIHNLSSKSNTIIPIDELIKIETKK